MSKGDLENAPAKSRMPDIAIEGYQILREIARGGTAIVYEALEASVERRVALKILPAAALLDQRQVNRFRTEAITAARFDHPHIVPVYTVGCKAALPYFTMKFIAGHSLAEQLELWRQSKNCDTRKHLLHAVEWCIQAADALQHIHSRGYLHGDLKPSNMLFDRAGKLWLADFGSARPIDADEESGDPSQKITPQYASPEQLLGNAAGDVRSDIYGLGVTLCELLTLRPVIVSDSVQDMLRQQAKRAQATGPDLSPALPSELNGIIARATAADPAQRFATAGDFAVALREVRDSKPFLTPCDSQHQPQGSRSKRGAAFICIAALLSLVLGFTPYIAKLSSACRQQQIEAAANEQLGSLVRLNQSELDEIADHLARGLQVGEKSQQLLKNGPSMQILDELAFDRALSSKLRLECAKTSYQLAEIHRQQFHFQESYKNLERTLQLCDALIEVDPRFIYRLDHALVQLTRAELCSKLNRMSEAADLAEQAITELRSVYNAHRDAPEASLALAWGLVRSNYMLYHLSPTEELEQDQRAAQQLLNSLDNLEADAVGELFPLRDPRKALVVCQMQLGYMTSNRQLLQRAREYAEEFSESGVSANWHRFLVVRSSRLEAQNLLAEGNSNESWLQAVETLTPWPTVESLEALTKQFPKLPDYQFELALCYRVLCDTARGANRDGEASDAPSSVMVYDFNRRAIEILAKLVEAYPEISEFRNALAGSLSNSAMNLSDQEAVPVLEQAIENQLIAVNLNPGNRDYLRYLSIQSDNLATRYASLDETEKHEQILRQAVEAHRRLVEQHHAEYQQEHQLAHWWLALGNCLANRESEDDCAEAYRNAASLFDSLFRDSGRKPHDVCMLATTYSRWADFLEDRENVSEARQKLELAIQAERRALAAEPDEAHRDSLQGYTQRLESIVE